MSAAPGVTSTVAAVIVYFRSDETILRCVRSLRAQTYAGLTEIVLVANSPVPAPMMEALEADGVTVHESGSNLGFGVACNLGAALVENDYVWFVNPDVEAPPETLVRLMGSAGESTSVVPAVIGPKGTPERIVRNRRYISAPVLLLRTLGVGRKLGTPKPPSTPSTVPLVTAPCWLIPRGAFQRVSGFDPSFFLYGEDMDLSLRLADAGVTHVYASDVPVSHASGTGAGGAEPPLEINLVKGREIKVAHARLLAKHRGPWSERFYLAGLRCVLPIRLLGARLLGKEHAAVKDRSALEWVKRYRGGRKGSA
jgi:GT2 family glycosyltransferase